MKLKIKKLMRKVIILRNQKKKEITSNAQNKRKMKIEELKKDPGIK